LKEWISSGRSSSWGPETAPAWSRTPAQAFSGGGRRKGVGAELGWLGGCTNPAKSTQPRLETVTRDHVRAFPAPDDGRRRDFGRRQAAEIKTERRRGREGDAAVQTRGVP
jgi:hypothetical protein